MGMDIQPRVAPPPDRDPAGRSRSGAGGLISLVSKWKPLKTPKLTASLTVYVLGLFVAFVARPPVAITDEMQARYFERMEAADAIHHEQRMEAERLLLEARAETQATKDSRWFCWADAACREALSARRAAEAERLEAAMVYRRARDERVRLAKAELGLWSALGVDEAKALFRQSYERGKLFATRSSYYDTFWLILAGRSDQNLAELLIRWGFTVLSNFTVGMMSAVVNFMWALPGLISTYATSTASVRNVQTPRPHLRRVFESKPSATARRPTSTCQDLIGRGATPRENFHRSLGLRASRRESLLPGDRLFRGGLHVRSVGGSIAAAAPLRHRGWGGVRHGEGSADVDAAGTRSRAAGTCQAHGGAPEASRGRGRRGTRTSRLSRATAVRCPPRVGRGVRL